MDKLQVIVGGKKDHQELHFEIIYDGETPIAVEVTPPGVRLDRFDLLAVASAMGRENHEDGFALLRYASELFHPQKDSIFNELYSCVATTIVTRESKLTCEYGINQYFNNHCGEIIPGAVLIHRKDNRRDIPDAWIVLDGKEMPVEIKRGSFGKAALSQLNGYMETYGADYGLAVGEKLTVKLPDNIQYISCKGWV